MTRVDEGYRSRREHETRHVIDDLRAELSSWTSSASEGRSLEKHESQVRSVVLVLTTVLDRIDLMPPDERALRAADIVLDLHHLWDFFRSKLLIRQVPRYGGLLEVTDELAWSLYEPVMLAAAPQSRLREPPLTFPSRQPVPFATARGSDFEDMLSHGKQRTLDGRKASKYLPVPLISLPWSSGRHLPSLLAVAHETAHHIEDDFGLTPSLLARLRSVTGMEADRLLLWERWLGEAFADICATVACGPAYVWALADALRTAEEHHAGESADYPPNRLRLLICHAALPSLQEPYSLPPLPGHQEPADTEPDAVVRALLSDGMRELGGKGLRELIGLRRPADIPEEVARLRNALRTRRRDVPGILATATLAFVADPSAYEAAGIGERCMNEVIGLRQKGKRHTVSGGHGGSRDSRAGDALFELLHDRAEASGPRVPPARTAPGSGRYHSA